MKCTLAIGALTLAAVPVFAALPVGNTAVVTRTGTPSGFWTRGGTGGINVAVSWNQAAGTEFNNGNIVVRMHSTSGSVAAQGLAYLYSAPGLNASLSSATLVTGTAPNDPFPSNPAPISTSATAASPYVAFTGGTPLRAAVNTTYFLVIVPAPGAAGYALAIDFGDPSTTTTTYSGAVTVNPDLVTTGAVGNPPNATTTFVNASPNTILYGVSGDVGAPPAPTTPTGVPTVGASAMVAVGALLALSGLWFLRAARQA